MFLNFFEEKIENVIRGFSTDDYRIPIIVPDDQATLECFQQIDIPKIKSIILKANPTFCDNDPIPFKKIFIDGNLDKLTGVVTELVNTSITTKVFPDSEKCAIVKPIVKANKDPQSLTSYRPVSNLTFLSKVFEKVILEQLMEYLLAINIFPDNQSAYRRLYSTETTLCAVVNNIMVNMDEGKCSILILLDLSAAFDTVEHNLLIQDCQNIGIVNEALEYLVSYLADRTYRVQIGDAFSETRTLLRGVPQGSVLGPILFCIYTIGLAQILKNHGIDFKLYADDTQFYLTLTNIVEAEIKVNEIMSEIKRWMNSKRLKLNEDKTECLVIGKNSDLVRYDLTNIKVLDTDMPLSNKVKDLGIIIDKNLSFCDQVNSVVKIANYHLKNLSFVRKYLDIDSMKKLIHNHVISRLDYCNSVYYGLPNYLLKKLQMIMNRAARLIKTIPRRERITTTLIELHWLPIKARIVYKICVLTFQAKKLGKPTYLNELLEDYCTMSQVILRHNTEHCRLNESRYNQEIGRRAFKNCAPRLFNKLPASVKQCDDISVFKKRLKTHLFAECYDMQTRTIEDEYKC